MRSEINYLDFEISVQTAGEDEFRVHAKFGDGEAETRLTGRFKEAEKALVSAFLTTKAAACSSGAAEKMKEVGSTLFKLAITGEVGELFDKCQGQADQQGKGIRYRLSLDPSVSDLPWEFLYFDDEFLALNLRSPIVRYIKGAARVPPLMEDLPLRLLIVIASPSVGVALDAAAEKERITTPLTPLIEQGLVDVTFVEGPETWARLIDALRHNRTHILHFIGLGSFRFDTVSFDEGGEGVLVMEDIDGEAIRIDSERLQDLVRGKPRLRLVVLNSFQGLGMGNRDAESFSSVAAGLMRSGMPAVIAMQSEISDHAAREFTETFYTSLATNMPVDAALTEARRKIFLFDRDSLEWAAPNLYMQVPDGQLFRFEFDKGSVNNAGAGASGAVEIVESVRREKSKIFISYRRNDSEWFAGRLFDQIGSRFGEDQVFMDIVGIEPGEDFVDVIQNAVSSCRVLIAIIGNGWLASADGDGNRRLDVPDDFVRVEISTALERNIKVIPLLVKGTAMPQAKDLPEALTRLARLNALEISSARWKYDVGRLIEKIEKVLSA